MCFVVGERSGPPSFVPPLGRLLSKSFSEEVTPIFGRFLISFAKKKSNDMRSIWYIFYKQYACGALAGYLLQRSGYRSLEMSQSQAQKFLKSR